MSDSANKGGTPRAMIHQRIMDVAAEQPDASLGEIADAVPGATLGMVERVLDEYGDPADTGENESADTAHDSGEHVPTLDALTEKQGETLYAIQSSPDATQRELAAELDVSAATISQRVNGIAGFEWSQREAFANDVLDAQAGSDDTSAMPDPDDEQRTAPDEQPDTDDADTPTDASADDADSRVPSSDSVSATRPMTRRPIVMAATDVSRDSETAADTASAQAADGGQDETAHADATMDGEPDATIDGDTSSTTATVTVAGSSSDTQATSDGGAVTETQDERFDHLHDRLTELEAHLDELGDADDGRGDQSIGGFDDPTLAAKVVRACIEAEDIDEAEEVAIIETLLE